MSLASVAPLLLVLPMAGFLITALIGRRLDKQAHWIPVLAILAVWVISIAIVVICLRGTAPLIPGPEDIHGSDTPPCVCRTPFHIHEHRAYSLHHLPS